jgi:predicted DNA-binding transcriptional regulator AlpA
MKYLSLNELSSKLGGRSRSTIYRDVAIGRLPPFTRLGGRIYWDEDAVDQALKQLQEATND